MKKTYISPEALTVQLGTITHLMEPSLTINQDGEITDPDDILTKEQAGITDKNIWDEER